MPCKIVLSNPFNWVSYFGTLFFSKWVRYSGTEGVVGRGRDYWQWYATNETATMMVEESSSIRLRLEDRINTLPISILHHILSFLPTKTSVRTSLVCRRWRNLWTNLQTFNFCDNFTYMFDNHGNIEQFLPFTVFVNAVLSLRTSRDTRKFHLSCAHSPTDPFFARSINTWISTVVGPQLEEFHLTLHCLYGVAFNLPQPLLSCSNLVSIR